MKDIRFRGKCLEDIHTGMEHIEKGEWISGYYFYNRSDKEDMIILQLEVIGVDAGLEYKLYSIPIDHDTLGIHTGKYDKNDIGIYTGDIVVNSKGIRFVVKWEDIGFNLQKKEKYEILGNVHDHTNLL